LKPPIHLIGGPFVVDRVKKEDLEAGTLKSSWVPAFDHPSMPADDPAASEALSRYIVTGSLISIENGAWDVSEEWNQLLPLLKLTGIQEFLEKVWKTKG
jgi:hypothetical protein